MMPFYSFAWILAAVLGLPWWIARLRRSPEERAALRERLGAVPPALLRNAAAFRNVWLHAVSVGEVLAASRLVPELTVALEAAAPGDRPWRVVVSTTTMTGQRLARERFGDDRVFFNPIDLRFAVRHYLRALRPAALILMEGELWPRLLQECSRDGIPVAVANARVSDRSFGRTLPLRALWRWALARHVALWCAQGAADAERLRRLGADPIHITGNLKYDIRAPRRSAIAERLRAANPGRAVVVCGSTTGSTTGDAGAAEEALLLREALPLVWQARPDTLVVLAPRHPERFEQVREIAGQLAGPTLRASLWVQEDTPLPPEARVLLLDTIGDLAAIYALADAAFVGGSLLPRGGHNPLEPVQFGVPVVTGPSEENFREVTAALREAGGLMTGQTTAACGRLLADLLLSPALRAEAGERARQAFEQQGGATARAVQDIVPLILAAATPDKQRSGARP